MNEFNLGINKTDSKNKSEQLFKQLINTVDTMLWDSTEPFETFYQKINDCFNKLIKQSKIDGFFWQFCPVEVYADLFNQRLNKFLSSNNEKNIIDFIGREKQEIEKGYKASLNLPQFNEQKLPDNKHYLFLDTIGKNKGESIQTSYIPLDFIESGAYFSVISNQVKKIEFLDSKSLEISSSDKSTSPHPTIFVDAISFKLFEQLIENIGIKHADITFIYRIMLADGFIHQQSEGAFNIWVNKEMNIPIDSRLQQLDRVATSGRKNLYKLVLNQFQLKSKTYS